VTLVLDASVLLKWFIDEPGAAAAAELKRRHLDGDVALVIPALALYEVPNVLRFKRGVPAAAVQEAMRALWTLSLDTVAPTEELTDAAIRLSFLTGLSVYDCAYLALAEELDASLVTADASLSRVASTLIRTILLR
jgi:predicted nucleic acid-binding protein